MTKILSFCVTGEYASFRDPSITTNQTVYYIPSKTAVVGMLGAMIGIKRDNNLGAIYSEQYLEFFSKVRIGIRLDNNPRKIIYFTNHRSLKAPKTKPVKKEILESPKYTIYVVAPDDILDKIHNTIKNNSYVFSPYLGHAYCPAKISDLQMYDGSKVDNPHDSQTECVVLDETDTYNVNFELSLRPTYDNGSMIIERHLHHFFEDNTMQMRVLKHWIPLGAILCEITKINQNKLSEFYEIDKKVYCLY